TAEVFGGPVRDARHLVHRPGRELHRRRTHGGGTGHRAGTGRVRGAVRYSMTAIRSPSWTTSPSLTANCWRTPSDSARTGISIFIDSRMTRVSPSATSSPALATTFHTLATISARISSAIRPASLRSTLGCDQYPTTDPPPQGSVGC